MIEINRDLQDIVISALRYALGRRTYITKQTADFIKVNSRMMDQRMRNVMLHDIEDYMKCRKLHGTKDDQCDYSTWLDLKKWLEELGWNK